MLATERELSARRQARRERSTDVPDKRSNSIESTGLVENSQIDNSASSILKKLEGRDSRVICNKLLKKHNVVPGVSWGSLGIKLQK